MKTDDISPYDYTSLLNDCFEIEGLLSLLRLRDTEAPDEILTLLRQKVATLATALDTGADTISTPECPPTSTVLCVDTPVTDNSHNDEAIADNALYEEAADTNISDDGSTIAPAAAQETPTAVAPSESTDSPSLFDDEILDLNDSVLIDDDDMIIVDDDTDSHPLTVDEKIAREGTLDLRHAFSLNDKYRFRRELFGNSDVEFLDALNLITAMKSYAEAEEYFYDDLGWRPDADDVKDFLAIVRMHFDARGQ